MRREVYKRPPGKTLYLPVRRRETAPEIEPEALPAPLVVDKATECHVTPPDVAARMVDYLGPCGDIRTLEPSAGTGNLVDALLKAGQSRFEVVAIERHCDLWAAMRARFAYQVDGFNRCFLDYAVEARGKITFPRVVMNPPFRKARVHIDAALSLMGCNGHDAAPVLVACVPSTFEHSRAEFLESLEPDTFAAARVSAKLIRIEGD